jgi:hypothetical protein
LYTLLAFDEMWGFLPLTVIIFCHEEFQYRLRGIESGGYRATAAPDSDVDP